MSEIAAILSAAAQLSLANLHLRFTAISNTHFIAYGAADVATLAAQKSKAEDKYADQSLF